MRALAKDPAHRFPRWPLSSPGRRRHPRRAARVRGARGAEARSIAVLPFVNASPDPENEYLSDGITDELIDALAQGRGAPRRVAHLGVRAQGPAAGRAQRSARFSACRTCSRGRVRRAGDRLRITAQLSSADDGRLLWSQRYDRTLDDVFAIQDEIARTIVTTLRATSFADLARRGVARRAPRTSWRTACTSADATAGTGAPRTGSPRGSTTSSRPSRWIRVRPGLHGARRLLRAPGGLPGDPERGGARARPRARARAMELDPSLAAAPRVARLGALHLRLGLGRRGRRVPARDRARSAPTRRRTSGTPSCSHPRGRGRGARGGAHGGRPRPRRGRPAPLARLAVLLRAPLRPGPRPPRPGDRDEPDRGGDAPRPRLSSSRSRGSTRPPSACSARRVAMSGAGASHHRLARLRPRARRRSRGGRGDARRARGARARRLRVPRGDSRSSTRPRRRRRRAASGSTARTPSAAAGSPTSRSTRSSIRSAAIPASRRWSSTCGWGDAGWRLSTSPCAAAGPRPVPGPTAPLWPRPPSHFRCPTPPAWCPPGRSRAPAGRCSTSGRPPGCC